jgi:hypothetical protein
VNGQPVIVAETSPGVANGAPTELTAFNGRLFFAGTAQISAADGVELMQIDPTAATPQVTMAFNLNTNLSLFASSRPHNLAVIGDGLYLTANLSGNTTPQWANFRVNADFSLTRLTALDGLEVDFTEALLTDRGILLSDPAGFLDPLTGSFSPLAGVSDAREFTPFTFFDYEVLNITGGAGNDTLIGTDGVDNISGLGGDDAIQGGKGGDTLTGGEGADNIGGGDGNDTIYGEGGNDVIDAGAGDDLIHAGAGDDFINGGLGTDTLSYADSLTGVTIDLSLGGAAQQTGGSGADQLLGVEILEGSDFADLLKGNLADNLIRGGAGADRLEGGDGVDTLIGGDGNDILIGGKGMDILTGGAGADWFVFLDETFGPDTITDFESGVDKIVFITSGFRFITPNTPPSLVDGNGDPAGFGELWGELWFPHGDPNIHHIITFGEDPPLRATDLLYMSGI